MQLKDTDDQQHGSNTENFHLTREFNFSREKAILTENIEKFIRCRRLLANHFQCLLESRTKIILRFLQMKARINVVKYLPHYSSDLQ